MLTDVIRKNYADALYRAWITGSRTEHITALNSEADEEDAYRIQLINVDRMLSDGYKITGKKIGLTSKPMQELFGVDVPDYGHLFDCMDVSGEAIDTDRLIQPKVEGEIAFILERDLAGPEVTVQDVLAATAFVVPALEIVDSRYSNWKIKLADTVADNGSSALYVLGEARVKPAEIRLPEVKMDFYKNGMRIDSGSGSAVLGDPAFCVAWLANKLSAFDVMLRAGEVILSGAITAALIPEKGDRFEAVFPDFGRVSADFR